MFRVACAVALGMGSPFSLTAAVADSADAAKASIPWSQIGAKAGAEYRGDGLAVMAIGTGARLRCVFQRLEAEATSEGLWLTSTVEGSQSARFRVMATAAGRQASERFGVPAPTGAAPESFQHAGLTAAEPAKAGTPNHLLPRTGTVQVADKLVRFRRPGVIEEYTVCMDGLRQDFIIEQRPVGSGPLRVELEVAGAKVEPLADSARLVLENSGRKIAYSRLRVTDATGKELTARMEVEEAGARRSRCLNVAETAEAAEIPDTAEQNTQKRPEGRAPTLAVVVNDADAVYPVRIDPTFSDANWISMSRIPGADNWVSAAVVDGLGNLYIGGAFTAVGDVIANHIAKWDGSSWTALGSGISGPESYPHYGGSVRALAVLGSDVYAGGYFTTAGGSAANYIAKWNGSTWTALGSGMNGGVHALAVSGSKVYAGGEFEAAGGTAANYIAKWDGSTWTALGSGMGGGDFYPGYVYALAVSGSDDVYAGGYFTIAGGSAANYIAKWDGSTWTALGSGMVGTDSVTLTGVFALAVSGSDLYAGGVFTSAGGNSATNIAKWNGSTWTALGSGMNQFSSVEALAVSGSDVYAGGYFTTAGGSAANYIAKWNGSSWTALGSGINYGVLALAVSGSDLYAGGVFTSAGGSTANYIAKWNGSAWSAPGSGMGGLFGTVGTNPYVSALAVSGSDVYAGGVFASAGGNAANNIAKWNGSSWSALGSGMRGPLGANPSVSALAVSGSDLYAGGSFTRAGGSTANNIAKWNGSSWSALGSGMDGPRGTTYVSALAVSGSGLYAGGIFATAGGNAATNIAKWNGSSWSALGSGMNGGVVALAVSGSDLYAGGDFTTAGGSAANNIAKWNGSSWSALGSGMDGTVYALAVSGSDVYAGGYFTTAGGRAANNIAKWNGSSWSALGSGMDSLVFALALSGSDLYAGGPFTTADGIVCNKIAKWNGSTWTALGSGMNTTVRALSASGRYLYAGGYFTTAGGKASAYIARAYLLASAADTPPIADSQSVTTAEDTSVAITLATSDAEGDELIYMVLSPPGRGALTGRAPYLTYTPNPNESGTDSFTFQVNDGSLNSAVATVSIAITPVNDAPVANSQLVAAEEAPVTITLSGSDIEGAALTFMVLSGPTNGNLSGTAPNLTYTPNPNESGTDSFTFQVNDGSLNSAAATVSINPLQTWSVRKGGNDLHAVGFGNGKFVAVGDAGTILTSDDGRIWEGHIYAGLGNLRGVAFGDGKFVAAGDRISTSFDGITWSRSGVTGPFRGIGYGNGLFVVVGDQGRILSSGDGATWTERNSSVTNSLNGVAWGNGKFVVAGDGLILTSNDTITWSPQTKTDLILDSVTYGNGIFVIGGAERDPGLECYCIGVLLSSDDGVAWTNRFSLSYRKFSMAYGNGVFVGVRSANGEVLPDDRIFTSTNGVNWTVLNSGLPNGPYHIPSSGLFGVGYGKNTFVAVGPIGEIALSTNGLSWEQIGPDSYDHLYDVASGVQTFVAVGQHGAIYSSVGRDSWIRQSSPATNDLTSVAFGNGVFVAVSSDGTIVSTNEGKSWLGAAAGPRGPGPKLIFQNGLFVTARGNTAFISGDGVNWSANEIEYQDPFAHPYGSSVQANDLTYGSGVYVLAGDRTFGDALGRSHSAGAIWTTAGQEWNASFGQASPSSFSSCVYGNGRFLVAGNTNLTSPTYLTSTNGSNWSPWSPAWPPWEVPKVLFANGTFIALQGPRPPNSGPGGGVLLSTNGLEWTATQHPIAYRTFLSACYGQGTFVLVGAFGTIVQSAEFIAPPVAGADTVERFATQDVKVKVATLLANDTDANGDALSIKGVTSPSPGGATVTLDGEWVYYTPPPGFTSADSFTYTVSDGRGGTAIGTVTVNVKVDSGMAQNIAGIQGLGNGTFRIMFNGIPGRTYTIQYTETLNPPDTVWTPLGPARANDVGVFNFNDTAGSAARFYRSTYP
jgi:hypothetical protein